MKIKRSVKSNLVIAAWIFAILLLVYFSAITISELTGKSISEIITGEGITGNAITGNVIFDGRELYNGIISYYSFDDGTSNDKSSSGFNGVFRDGSSIKTTNKVTQGKFGDGAYFDGVNDFIRVDNFEFKDVNDKGEGNDFSFSLWAKPYFESKTSLSCNSNNDCPSGVTCNVVTHLCSSSTTPNRGLLLWVEGAGDFSQGYFAVDQYTKEGITSFLLDSNDWNYWAYTPVDFTSQVNQLSGVAPKWIHIVGVFSAETERISLYIDGAKVAERKVNSDGPLGKGTLWIGKVYNDYYKGVIDDVVIYNRALTENQIVSIYNQGLPCPTGQEFKCPSGYELVYASNLFGSISQYTDLNCQGNEYVYGLTSVTPLRKNDWTPLCRLHVTGSVGLLSSKVNGNCINLNPSRVLTNSPPNSNLYRIDNVGTCAAPSADPEQSPCTSNSDCSSGQTCNVVTGKCGFSLCTSNSNCPSGQTCNVVTGICSSSGCTSNNDCSSGQTCNILTRTCQSSISCIDADHDGYNKSATGCGVPDCYDTNDVYGKKMNPGNLEVCDGLDNDCDGVTDDNYICPVGSYYCDGDEDGFYSTSAEGVCTTYDCSLGISPVEGCVFEVGDDCRDNDADINSDGWEICENGIDDDCFEGDASCDDICAPGEQKCEGTKIHTCGANSLWDSGVDSVVCGYNSGGGNNNGGGDSSNSCSPLWRCTNWSNQGENCGTRTCSIFNSCSRQIGKPLESVSCESGGVESYCGDGACDSDEDSISCKVDCPINFECGDGICEEDMGESLDICVEDCRVRVTNPWIFWIVFILIIIGVGVIGYLIYYKRKKMESLVQTKSI